MSTVLLVSRAPSLSAFPLSLVQKSLNPINIAVGVTTENERRHSKEAKRMFDIFLRTINCIAIAGHGTHTLYFEKVLELFRRTEA